MHIDKTKQGGFDFLGFTHYWGKSQKGKWVVKRKTASKRLQRSLRAVTQWCREHRHETLRDQHQTLKRKLQGHYQYYGISGNFRCLAIAKFLLSLPSLGLPASPLYELYEISYNRQRAQVKSMQQQQKPAIFIDGSRRTLKDFPDLARWLAGNEINELQWGRMPEDWKPMLDVGPGALEIRIHDPHEYRVICVAKFAEAILYPSCLPEKNTKDTKERFRYSEESLCRSQKN